jgi:hypothetical protein
MRTVEQKPDGTLELSPLKRELVDVERFLKMKGGMSITDIAKAESIPIERAERSVRQGAKMYEAEHQIRLRDAKYQSAIDNEKIRTDLRKRVTKQLIDSVETLLKGEKTVVEINKETGEVTFHTITDPEMIALGVEAASRILSLPEKAGPSMILNLQQNNMLDQLPGVGMGMSYEERLSAIQEAQANNPIKTTPTARPAQQFIDVDAVAVPDVDMSEAPRLAQTQEEEPLF